MLCPSCGNSNPDTARFCTKCGSSLGVVPEGGSVPLSRCPKCGYQPEGPSKFCTKCGASMETPAQPQSQQRQTQNAAPQPNPAAYQAPPQQPYAQYAQPGVYYNQPYQPDIVYSLCSKLKVSKILHLIAGIIDAIAGVIFFIAGLVWLPTAIEAANYGVSSYYAYFGGVTLGLAILYIIYGLILMFAAVCNFVGFSRASEWSRKAQTYPVGIVQHFTPAGSTIALLVLNVCGLIFGVGVIGLIGSIFGLLARSHVMTNKTQFMALEQTAMQR